MLARGALCRSTASTPTTRTRDLPYAARFLQRTLPARHAACLPKLRDVLRAYATATATSATKPTATVKRAVKAQAAAKSPPKKRAAAPKTATGAASKPKPKPRARAATKAPKKAAPAPKKRAPQLTPEQKQKADIKKQKAKLAELRKVALKEPVSHHVVNAYSAFIGDQTAGNTGNAAAASFNDATQKWKSLTPAEREHYNHLAREQTAARQAEYRAWIRSHTLQETDAANKARAQIRRMLKGKYKKQPAHTIKLVDDRHVKGQKKPFILFFSERQLSGDLKGISVPEAAKLVSEEWKALSAGEKKKYEDEATVDKERYDREMAAAHSA